MAGAAQPSRAPALRVSGLTVVRPRFTLHPMSFDIAPGERVAMVGPNGAGKSTTMSALAGRLPVWDGTIELHGKDLRQLLPEARARLGFLPERVPGYEEVTVREHLAFLAAFHERWNASLVDDLLRRLGVDPGQAIGKLSKGNRVKVGFIAAEAMEPEVLLLDEPTSGLDPVIRGELLDIIDECLLGAPGRALVFSTHLLEDIDRVATRVLVIRDGRLADDQPVSAISASGVSTAQALYERLRTHD